MNLRKAGTVVPIDGRIEYMIRWGLHGLVTGAKPSPQVWERIEECIISDAVAAEVNAPAWRRALPGYGSNLFQVIRYLRGLSGGNWQQMAVAHTLAAETSVFNGLGFRWC